MAIDMSYLAYRGTAPQTTVGEEQDIVRDMALANPAERTATAANVGGGFGGSYTAESPLGYEGADDKSDISTPVMGTTGGTNTSRTTTTQSGMGYSPTVLPVALSRNTGPTTTQYANLGLATMGTVGHASSLAGDFFGNNFLKDISSTIGKVGTVGSLLLNAYQIATGDIKGGVTGLAKTGISQGIQYAASDAGKAALTSALGNAGTTLGSLAGGVSIAMPWYAAAKLGGVAINAVTANNPEMKGSHIDLIGHGLEEPLDVEGGTADWLADKGIGSYSGNRAIASAANPIGGLMKDVQSGNYSNIPNTLLSGSIGQSALVGSSIVAPFVAPALMGVLPFAGLISSIFGKEEKSPVEQYQDNLRAVAQQEIDKQMQEAQMKVNEWKVKMLQEQQYNSALSNWPGIDMSGLQNLSNTNLGSQPALRVDGSQIGQPVLTGNFGNMFAF